jgi:serine/threonine protein kinase
VVVSPDLSRVKLTDFGVGRIEALAGTTGTIATSELSLGTLHYLAPEQAEGRPADARADIYAAGAIFHEMLTGRPPGGKFTLPSQLDSALTPDVDVLVLKCMARNPAERYGTVVHLLGDLEKLEETLRLRVLAGIEGITRSLRGKPEAETAATAERRRPVVLWVVIGVAILALVVAGVVLLL